MTAYGNGGCLLSSHTHPQTMPCQPSVSTSRGVSLDQGEGNCRAVWHFSSNHIRFPQVDISERYLRSYCIHWHICTLFCWCLKIQTDVPWLSWTSFHYMGIRSQRADTIFEHSSVYRTRCRKPTLFCCRLWYLPDFAHPVFGFRRNSSRSWHAHPNWSLPDQLWIKSNHQLIA